MTSFLERHILSVITIITNYWKCSVFSSWLVPNSVDTMEDLISSCWRGLFLLVIIQNLAGFKLGFAKNIGEGEPLINQILSLYQSQPWTFCTLLVTFAIVTSQNYGRVFITFYCFHKTFCDELWFYEDFLTNYVSLSAGVLFTSFSEWSERLCPGPSSASLNSHYRGWIYFNKIYHWMRPSLVMVILPRIGHHVRVWWERLRP